MKNADLFQNESDYPELDYAGAAERLCQALRIPTVSYTDVSRVDWEQFDRLHSLLKASYPRIMGAGSFEEIGRSVLITIPGTDPGLAPACFMAHQDVVPIQPGTEGDWRHGPFSGDIAEGYIWGRGAMDIKQMLIAILESAEYLLSRGRPRRTLLFAFGEDEETNSRGAHATVDLLKSRGIRPAFVLDEGAGDVTDAADYGAPGTLLCSIGTYEKGYADLRLRARARGGHSSNPFRGTSLGALARAITGILNDPPPAHLSDALRRTLTSLAPRITEEPMRTWVRDIDAHEAEILAWCQSHESLYHQVRTTLAPTMISGGSAAGNVMPQNMEAVINCRLSPPDTPESLLAHCQARVDGEIELDYLQQIGPSRPSDPDAWGFGALKTVLEHYFRDLLFVPAQNRGATDVRNYEELSDCCLRFGPFLEEEDVSAEGVHGTNERISLRAYCQGIRVLTRLMETACF